jgi:hypothetical protein
MGMAQLVVAAVVVERGGHEAGAATIAFHLSKRHGSAPAVSTIWRILDARGFVTPQPHKRPKSSYIRFVAEQPNERWQLDITHWALADDSEMKLLDLLDDHSRLCVASHARGVFKAANVDDCFGDAASCYGDPATVLSDNGAVFTGRSRGQGRVALEVTLARRGIRLRHSRPYHPRPAARWSGSTRPSSAGSLPAPGPRPGPAPRPARCLRWLLQHPAAPPRPGPAHPIQAYQARPKAVPTGLPLDDTHYRIRHDKIDSSGVFTLRHNSRLHHIGVGRRHAGTDMMLAVVVAGLVNTHQRPGNRSAYPLGATEGSRDHLADPRNSSGGMATGELLSCCGPGAAAAFW